MSQNQRETPKRKRRVGLVTATTVAAAVSLSLMLIAPAEAAAPAAAPAAVNAVAVTSLSSYTSVTSHCGTGGFSWQHDSMFVNVAYNPGKLTYTVRISHSPNREIDVATAIGTAYVYHKALAIYYTVGNKTIKFTNPPSVITFTARSSAGIFHYVGQVTDYGSLDLRTSCYTHTR